MNTTKRGAHVRWAIRRDTASILEIEHASFKYPWTEEDFLREFRKPNCIPMVSERGEDVVGFMAFFLERTVVRVAKFAVHPDFVRQGIGTRMIQKLKGKLSSERRNRIKFQVRETNLAAQLFLKSQGFRATSVSRGYFKDSGETSYLMQYFLDPCLPVIPGETAFNLQAQFSVTED
jgi:[ribosomal protein S18]-alanine N-acetyltransferase